MGLDTDPNGDLWMASGTSIIKYDGANWIAFDVLNSGLSLAHAYPRSIDASLGDRIWISTRDRVVEYDIINDQWTVHDPSNNAVNFNASNIRVESSDKIWWTTGSRLYEYNGLNWVSHNLHQAGIHINSNSLSEIEINTNKEKWMTTPSSVCIEGGCFTPAGLVRLTATDTTLFDGENYGFPDATFTRIDLDSSDDPFLVANGNPSLGNFYMRYSNGQWSAPVDIPFEGLIYQFELGSEDQVYLAFRNFMAIGDNGTWDIIPLDTGRIDVVESMLLTPQNDIYIGGRNYKSGNVELGALGFLPNLNYKARGIVYSDKNSNGAFDGNDLPLKDHFVQTDNQDRISFSGNDGSYSILFSMPGTYTIEGVLPAYHSYSNPVDGKYTVGLSAVDPTSENNDIGYIPDTTAIDMAISITGSNGPNPGFLSCYVISVKNLAPRLTDADITLFFDDLLTFEYADVPPVSMNGNQFTFHLDDMDWLEVRNIRLCFSLPPDPVLTGDTLIHHGSVNPVSGLDLDLQNNVYALSQIIRGSFDPNYIEVTPAGIGETGDIPLATSRLEYTIHFQNVGTDTARSVSILNAIDENLDISTLQVLGSSHAYDISFIEDGRFLKWEFENINLPDSIANREESNGFVKYTIGLATHVPGTQCTNQADIYFDFNPPVTTNVTMNTLVDLNTSLEDVDGDAACDFITGTSDGNLTLYFPEEDNYEIRLYEWSGRQFFSSHCQSKEIEIDLGDIPSGCYVLSVTSSGCFKSTKVFLK